MRVGIDLVEHKDMLDKDDNFAKRILSSLEFENYIKFTHPKRKLEYLASRFAAKEAIFKCLQRGFIFSEVSILNKENGAPYIQSSMIEEELHISLSHTDAYSVAIVINLQIARDGCA